MPSPDEAPSQLEKPIYPSPREFFLELPIYYKVKLNDDLKLAARILEIEYFDSHLDSYCVRCDKSTAFIPETMFPIVKRQDRNYTIGRCKELIDHLNTPLTQLNINDNPYKNPSFHPYDLSTLGFRNRVFVVSLKCPRDDVHKLKFIFRVGQGALEKIGQSPALADLMEYGVRQYRKILGDEKYREFTKAIGLASHGVGIGAFVYLRRIFEGLIEEAHSQILSNSIAGWDEESFMKSRLNEKIQMLKHYLPDFLVEHNSMYGILSQGIHTLTETECLKYFEPLRMGIELILDQKLEAIKRAEKIKLAGKSIRQITTELNSNPSPTEEK